MARTHLGQPVAYLDGPAGTQVPHCVIQAMTRYMVECNANHGGAFPTAVESDARLDLAHAKLATFVGASDPDEVVFGANMTSLTFAFSRAVARTWKHGDEVIVTRLDHDANVTPGARRARRGSDGSICRSRSGDLYARHARFPRQALPRTRLVAVGGASNAVGTINPIRDVIRAAASRRVGLRRRGSSRRAPTIAGQAMGLRRSGVSRPTSSSVHTPVCCGDAEICWRNWRPTRSAQRRMQLPGKWMTGTQSHEAICGAAPPWIIWRPLGKP
ncbi:MAG: aminotransferase class V-fold PLP-dependent enzyme [Pirellulaceae bacterium]